MGGLMHRQTTRIIKRTLSSWPGLYFFLHISASSGIFDLPKIPIFVLARPISILLSSWSANSDPFQFYQQQTKAMASRRHPRKGPTHRSLPTCTDTALHSKRHIHRSFRIIFSRFFFASTQPGAVSLQLYDFTSSVPCFTPLAWPAYCHGPLNESRLVHHSLASIFSSLISSSTPKKWRGRFLVGFLITRLYRGESSRCVVQWVIEKKRRTSPIFCLTMSSFFSFLLH